MQQNETEHRGERLKNRNARIKNSESSSEISNRGLRNQELSIRAWPLLSEYWNVSKWVWNAENVIGKRRKHKKIVVRDYKKLEGITHLTKIKIKINYPLTWPFSKRTSLSKRIVVRKVRRTKSYI